MVTWAYRLTESLLIDYLFFCTGLNPWLWEVCKVYAGWIQSNVTNLESKTLLTCCNLSSSVSNWKSTDRYSEKNIENLAGPMIVSLIPWISFCWLRFKNWYSYKWEWQSSNAPEHWSSQDKGTKYVLDVSLCQCQWLMVEESAGHNQRMILWKQHG